MWDTIRFIIAGIATIPILPFFIVYFGYSLYQGNRKKAIRLAMDVSTVFFVFNVGALFNEIFNSNFGLYLLLLGMIIGAGLLGNAHYRKDGNIPWQKIARIVWRVTFFVTVFLYLVFSTYVVFNLAFTV